ncbi:MAG: DUF222 domain-containing protein [Acidimicrobiales bacterium]
MARLEAAEARVAELMGVMNASTAALVDTLAEVVADGLWEGAGIRSPEHWVTWQCGVSPGRARALVATARRVGDLPENAAAFRSGTITEDQMAVIARHVPADRDGEVAELGRHMMIPQLRRLLGSLAHVEPPRRESDPKPEPVREVSFGYRDDSWWFCRMLLPPDEGAAMERVIEAGRDAVFAERHPDVDLDDPEMLATPGTPQPCDVGWADGAVRAAEAAMAGFGSLVGPSIAERYQTLLHVDVDDPTLPAHLHLGPALPAELRRMLSCDTTLRVIYEQAGIPVGYGRSQRSVPRRLRRVVEERDRGCRVPGCAQTRWLHIHHLVHWEDGGPTDLENLAALCPVHHRLHHHGWLAIDGDPNRPDGLVFTDPRTGRRLEPPKPRPPGGPPARAAEHVGLPPPSWQPPAGERMDLRWFAWRN